MTIAQMHSWFRQYAQQMGMQNVRAILPEQIDVLINTAIKDIIDEVVNRNVGVTNDRVITDNSKLANINALRTLYRVKTVQIGDNKKVSEYKNDPYKFSSELIGTPLYFVDFSIRYSDRGFELYNEGVKLNDEIADEMTTATDDSSEAMVAYRTAIYNKMKKAYKDFVDHLKVYDPITYADTSDILNVGAATSTTTLNTAKQAVDGMKNTATASYNDRTFTRWFPIRVIDDAYLADVLNDFMMSPRMRTPVMVIYAQESSNEYSDIELYVGENDGNGISTIANQKHIGEIRCSFIKKPNEVAYLSDVDGENVDSDLPEQLQIPMLKHAVDLYRASIQGSLFASQQNNQAQQQELARNNVRPDNEGYQS